MKMLITGGAGFIGSHLCEKYTKDGHTVICLDNFMNGNLTILSAVPIGDTHQGRSPVEADPVGLKHHLIEPRRAANIELSL